VEYFSDHSSNFFLFLIFIEKKTQKPSVSDTKPHSKSCNPWFNGRLIKSESAKKYLRFRAHLSKAVAHIQIYSSRIITKKPIHKQFLLRTSAIEKSSA
jgi:hypothetical protein